MDKFVIEGGRPLKGEIRVSGSKNATLPILAATLLTDEPCEIRNVPKLRDTTTMLKILKALGKNVEISKDKILITSSGTLSHIADYKMVSTMRGSFCVMGPLLAKLGKAKVSMPGGCIIGVRPVDLHMKGILALGAKATMEGGYVNVVGKLKGAHIYLGGVFGSSVLATANVMMAAVLAHGQTVIESAACEPEIEDLGNFLSAMGAKIEGHGTPRVVINGVRRLEGVSYRMSPDRIEAGTFILMAAATHSHITIRDVHIHQLSALVDKLNQIGVKIEKGRDVIHVKPGRNLKPVSMTTYPHPGFPTDLQAQYAALMSIIPGVTVITDKVFPDRFMHIPELNRMGAQIRREGGVAIIEGVKQLYGAPVMASDLRASAALVIAGLAAKGRTDIHRIYHLERGYEDLDKKLQGLGAKVWREKE